MLRCWRIRRWLSPYLDGELDERRAAALEAHLSRCGDCARDLDRSREVWARLATAAASPPLPEDLRGRVVRGLAATRGRSWVRRHDVILLRAACVSVCVGIGFFAGALVSWGSPATDVASRAGASVEADWVVEAFEARGAGLGPSMEEWFRCVPE